MGNACDCQLFFSPEEVRKTSLMIKGNKPREWIVPSPNHRSVFVLRHHTSNENYFPEDLSPMAKCKETMESIEEKVELFLSCELGSDNYEVQIDIHALRNGRLTLLNQTEIAKGSTHLEFTKSVVTDFVFEAKQTIRFDVMNLKDPNRPQMIGKVETYLSKIVGLGKSSATFDILNSEGKVGILYVKAEGIRQNLSYAEFDLGLKDIPKMPSNSTLFFKFSRILGEAGYVPIYQSENIPYSSQPQWEKTRIRVVKLCNNDYMRPIKLQIYTKSGKADSLVGEAAFTIDDLIHKEVRNFQLKNPIVKKSSGIATFRSLSLEEMPSFLDYIRGGVKIATVLAIDFTQSNGDPNNPNSLHAINIDGSLNDYQRAIKGISDILLDYDSDKKIPMYGFGGMPCFPQGKQDKISHCFALTGDEANPYAEGSNGIMDIYKNALSYIKLSGPTLFYPILQAAFKLAAYNKQEGSQEYIILVILTDGQILDKDKCIDLIVASADLPISIIMIGLGNEKFDDMRVLDGDQGLYDSDGNKAPRDIVQFVCFKDFENSHELLTREVLQEIPTQIVEYYTTLGVKPQFVVDVQNSLKEKKSMMMFASDVVEVSEFITEEVPLKQEPQYVPQVSSHKGSETS